MNEFQVGALNVAEVENPLAQKEDLMCITLFLFLVRDCSLGLFCRTYTFFLSCPLADGSLLGNQFEVISLIHYLP